ncbi:MAG: hypothetical protein ABWZ66_13330 [Pyrinomonadaceae bacterium]
MKIISLILLVIGLIICGISSLTIVYTITSAVNAAMNGGGSAGIGMIGAALDTSRTMGIVNLLGCAMIFFGIVFNIISLFTGRKQQQAI